MDKTITITFGSLLILLLLSLFASTPMVAQGGASSIIYGNRDIEQTDDEKLVATYTCEMIMYSFCENEAFYYCYNAYGDDTTASNVYSLAYYCEHNYDWCTVFYTGHGLYEPENPPCNYWIYANDGGDASHRINDTGIYPNTSLGKHYFVFLWACGGPCEIGDDDPVHGMPYCWTHDSGLSSGDYCYIGFQYASRGLHEYDPYAWYNYGDFVSFFYYYALQYHMSIYESLDWAAYSIMYLPFTYSELYYGYYVEGFYSKMCIYGNENLVIPY